MQPGRGGLWGPPIPGCHTKGRSGRQVYLAKLIFMPILKVSPEKILLTVKDNGVGIAREKVADPFSLGIIGMKERAIAMGGKVTIRGTKSKGTTVTLQIPLHKKGKSS